MSFDPFSFVGAPNEARARRQIFMRSAILCLTGVLVWTIAIVMLGGDAAPFAAATVAFLLGWIAARWALRRHVWDAWRQGRRTHRWAAIVTSLIGPGSGMFLVVFLPMSDPPERLAFGAIGILTLVGAYAFALFLFRWLGGEYDPPAAKGYRCRP